MSTRREITFAVTPAGPTNPANGLDTQRAAFRDAARIEMGAELDLAAQADRIPISRLLSDGQAIGPLRLKRISATEAEAIPTENFSLDRSELAVGKKGTLTDKTRKKSGSLTIKSIQKDKVILKVSKVWETPSQPQFLIRDGMALTGAIYERLGHPSPAWPPVNPDPIKAEKLGSDTEGKGKNFQECLALCLAENGLAGIKGPPGTGKTYLLAWTAVLLAKQGKSVLICTTSHPATDTALEKVLTVAKETRTNPKIAKKPRTGETISEELSAAGVAEIETLKNPKLYEEHKIVGAVIASIMASIEEMPKADFILIDEAGQVPAYSACALAPAAQNMVLFGDENQLDPILVGEHHDDLESAHSAAAFLRRRLPDRTKTLLVNHRSNQHSVEHTQKNYYSDIQLEAGDHKDAKIEGGTILLNEKEIKLGGYGTNVINIGHQNRKKHAPEESEAAAKIVKALLGKTLYLPDGNRPLESQDFAVLCPNKRQAENVRRALERTLPTGTQVPECGTVHRLQGQGRPVVIFSTTASHIGYMESQAEFLFAQPLWNVATSRAVAVTYILVNLETLNEAAPQTLAGLELKCQVMKSLSEISKSSSGTQTNK